MFKVILFLHLTAPVCPCPVPNEWQDIIVHFVDVFFLDLLNFKIMFLLILPLSAVQCSRGMFYDSSTSLCERCPIGTYQGRLGQHECELCPAGFSTLGSSGKSHEDCKGKLWRKEEVLRWSGLRGLVVLISMSSSSSSSSGCEAGDYKTSPWQAWLLGLLVYCLLCTPTTIECRLNKMCVVILVFCCHEMGCTVHLYWQALLLEDGGCAQGTFNN